MTSLPDAYRGAEVGPRRNASISAMPDRLDLRGLASVFRRRFALIALAIMICVFIAAAVTFSMPKLYTANVDIMLRTGDQQITPGKTDDPADQPQRAEEVETELQAMQSRDLAGKVFDRLNLRKDPAFGPPAQTADEQRQFGIARLQSGLSARRVGTAYVIRASFEDPDPKRAAAIANGYATTFVADRVEADAITNRKAIEILRSRMTELRTEAQEDFNAVQQYRIGNSLLSTAAAGLTEQEISTYNQQVAIARAEAARDMTRLSAARAQLNRGPGNVGEAVTSPVVQSLRSQRVALSTNVTDLSERYLDTHPELANAREQLANLDRQIDEEIRRSLRSLEAQTSASSGRLSSLTGSLGSARGTLAANNQAMVALNDLERTADASQELYESYLNRFKEAVARSGAEQPHADILSSAVIPARPSSPNLPLNLVLGLLVGALTGITLALIVEAGYSGLTTGQDIEERLGLRNLGSIPLLESVEPRGSDVPTTVAQFPGGWMAESVRNILVSVRQSPSGRRQVIAVTSALPGEGKTSLALALGRVDGLAGERAVVIDCDFVRSDLSRRVGAVGGRAGLHELVFGEAEIDDVLFDDLVDGLSIIPITTPFTGNERLLDRGKLHRAIAKLRERFPLIILDCPPILPVAETRELVTLADNVVIAGRWRKTHDRAVQSALKLLPLDTISDIGGALAFVDLRKRRRFGAGDPSFFYDQYKEYRRA